MSLTKATYSMIEGAPVNVLDFGADPTGVADSTAAFQAAYAAGYRIYVPEGTYSVTQLVAPNKITILEGASGGGTTINTSGAVGLDYQHYSNVYGSRNSEINNIRVIAAPGTTALRINNLGLNLNNSFFYGGQIGIDLNMMVNAQWNTVYAAGSASGVKVWKSTYNLSVDAVVWQNSFVNVQTGAVYTGYGWLSAGDEAFMRQNTFINLTTQGCLIGLYISTLSSDGNTFINWWAEDNIQYDIYEQPFNQNAYINPHYITVGASNVFGDTSWRQDGNRILPGANGEGGIGYYAQPSLGTFEPYGAKIIATAVTNTVSNLQPSNVSSFSVNPENYGFVQEESFYFPNGKATGSDLLSVTFNDRASGFITVELAGYGATQGGCKYTRYFSPSGGGYAFETVGTDFVSASANCSLTFSSTGTASFKVVYATTIAAHNFGVKVTVGGLSSQTPSLFGAKIDPL